MVLRGAAPRRPAWLLGAYLSLVCAAGLAVFAYVLVAEGTSTIGPEPWLFATFGVLMAVSECRPVTWLFRKGTSMVTPSWVFMAAALFASEGLVAAVLAGLASAIGDVFSRRPVSRVAFNASMIILSVSAGAGVLTLTGHRTDLIDGTGVTGVWFLVAVLAMAAMFLVNGVILQVVIALHQGLSIRLTMRRDLLRNLSTDGLLMSLGPVLVVLGRSSPLLLIPVVVVGYIVLHSSEVAHRRQHEATHDPLTSLPNRRLFLERLAEEVEAHGGHAPGEETRVLAVMIVDLDDFKEVNDNLGHDVGDAVLIEVAQRIKGAMEEETLVARLGGDEFAVLITGETSMDGARALADRVYATLAGPMSSNGFPLTVTGSVGVSCLAGDPLTSSQLMRRADVAMYSAKAASSGVMVFGSGIDDDRAPGRLSLVSQLGVAIERGELSVHYQPLTDMRDGSTRWLEALVRWEHPSLGLVAPGDFVPMAEQTDLIGPLTDNVLASALADCAGWIAEGHEVGVAVNVSARVLHDLYFPTSLAEAARKVGLAPSSITLEITENSVMRDPGRTARVLTELRALGVRVSVDDFGTGYSSLSSLCDLPLDELKIDRRFVASLMQGGEDEIIVRTVVALAGQMGLSLVAEGAETAEITARLTELGCPVIQGYHLARPMPAADVAAWLRDRPRPRAATPH